MQNDIVSWLAVNMDFMRMAWIDNIIQLESISWIWRIIKCLWVTDLA